VWNPGGLAAWRPAPARGPDRSLFQWKKSPTVSTSGTARQAFETVKQIQSFALLRRIYIP